MNVPSKILADGALVSGDTQVPQLLTVRLPSSPQLGARECQRLSFSTLAVVCGGHRETTGKIGRSCFSEGVWSWSCHRHPES